MKKNVKDTVGLSAIVLVATLITIFFNEYRYGQGGVGLNPQSVDYWQMFARISKERKYIEEVNAHYRIPVFTPELLAHSGKNVTLTGYYLPYSRLDSVIIISRYPNSSCFFCGQAGIESVAMVELGRPDQNSYRMDQMLLVQGKLSLNSTDINKLAFVIEDATVEEMGL